MPNKDETIVLPTSPEAATWRTNIEGWVSRHGRFFGDDERAARYDGSRHSVCQDCGKSSPKHHIRCASCREAHELARWKSAPRKEWDEIGMLFSEACERYYGSWDEAIEDCEDDGGTLESLRLYICVPNYAREIDASIWEGDLPEDADVPEDMLEAINALNAVIKRHREEGRPLSWSPDKTVPILPETNSDEHPHPLDNPTMAEAA